MVLNKLIKNLKKEKTLSKIQSTVSKLSREASVFGQTGQDYGNDKPSQQTRTMTTGTCITNTSTCIIVTIQMMRWRAKTQNRYAWPEEELSELSEDSGMDSDYDPNTGTSGGTPSPAADGGDLVRRMTQMSMKKQKTIIYPIKQTLVEKRHKLVQYGFGSKWKDENLLDDEKDAEAEIAQSTIDKLLEYYGHWSQFVIYLGIEDWS